MNNKQIICEYVSDITFSPIAKSIKNQTALDIKFIDCGISQHIQRLTLVSENEQPQVLIIHCSYDYFYKEAISTDQKNIGQELLDLIRIYLEKDNAPWIVINTVEATSDSLVGIKRMQILSKYYEFNHKLTILAQKYKKIRLVDIASTISNLGNVKAISLKNSIVMKLPYRKEAVEEIGREYSKIINEIYKTRKKLLVLDADNTLWGGVVGEDGKEGINIDQFNYPGVIYWKFQEQLIKIKESGVVLALVSKNNENDVVEAFESLDMPLRLDDFTIRKINWSDKGSNINEIAEALNLGLESFVFIDDNIFEIEQVKHSYPEVSCYLFPSLVPDEGLKLLNKISGLSAWAITKEDLDKTKMYAEEAQRLLVKSNAKNLSDYLESLSLKIEYGVNRLSQLTRVTQLINKTNQFNLTTRRYTEPEVETMMNKNIVYDFRVSDRFGEMGIVGVGIVKESKIDLLLMSCRALGREVESTMLKIICDGNNSGILYSEYVKSKKNQMVSKFYEMNGFDIIDVDGENISYRLNQGPKPLFNIAIKEIKE
jgi:FkbH-like protein